MCTVYFGRDDAAWLYPMNFVQWSDWMQGRDPLGALDEIEDAVMVRSLRAHVCSLVPLLLKFVAQPRLR